MSARAPQFALYERLIAEGIDVEAEVRLPASSDRSRSGHFYADLAVRRHGRVVALCECKARARELRGRQRENYDGSGLPYIVAGNDNIDEALQWLVKHATWVLT